MILSSSPAKERALMTAIAAFLRKTPVICLQDYFTAGGFTSLAPIDWPKPEPEVVVEYCG